MLKPKRTQNPDQAKAEIELGPTGSHVSLVGAATAVIALLAVVGIIIIATMALTVAEQAVKHGAVPVPQSAQHE